MINTTKLAVLFALATSFAAVAEEPVPRLSRLGGTEIILSDLGFAYCGPTIVTDDNDPKSPSYCLATIRTTNGKRRLLFLMILDYGGKQIRGAGWSAAPSIEGHDINDSLTAIINNTKRISFAFSYNTKSKSREAFSINGKVLDEKAPRVFIVDLKAETPKLTAMNAALPKAVPDFHSGDAVQTGKEWSKMIDELKGSSPEIKKFIDGYGKE